LKLRVARLGVVLALMMAGAAAQSGPLSFQIGALQFSPGGFLDFTTVFRSTALGSGLGTSFAAVPYNNTTAGRVTELRESAQNSRLNLRVSGERAGATGYAYLETDFLGNSAGNLAVSSNSATLRLRVFYVDARRGTWELAAGQDWSLLTPNRVGASPLPSEVFTTADFDSNHQVGLTNIRQPQIRLIYHASPHWTAAFSAENGEPYIGGSSGASLVTLPEGPNGPYGGQDNNGASGTSAPSLAPDFIAKIAYDSAPSGHALHLEAVGLESTFRALTPATNRTAHAAGSGVSVNGSWEAFKGLSLVATSFLSHGGGRYFGGLAPDLVIRQNGEVSPVRTDGGTLGFEARLRPADLFYGDYGGLTIAPNFDLTGATPVGYGYPGSIANRTIQEATAGWEHTFWKSAQYGALDLIAQASYVTRSPFAAPPAGPKNAHLGMGFLDLRYVLP